MKEVKEKGRRRSCKLRDKEDEKECEGRTDGRLMEDS